MSSEESRHSPNGTSHFPRDTSMEFPVVPFAPLTSTEGESRSTAQASSLCGGVPLLMEESFVHVTLVESPSFEFVSSLLLSSSSSSSSSSSPPSSSCSSSSSPSSSSSSPSPSSSSSSASEPWRRRTSSGRSTGTEKREEVEKESEEEVGESCYEPEYPDAFRRAPPPTTRMTSPGKDISSVSMSISSSSGGEEEEEGGGGGGGGRGGEEDGRVCESGDIVEAHSDSEDDSHESEVEEVLYTSSYVHASEMIGESRTSSSPPPPVPCLAQSTAPEAAKALVTEDPSEEGSLPTESLDGWTHVLAAARAQTPTFPPGVPSIMTSSQGGSSPTALPHLASCGGSGMEPSSHSGQAMMEAQLCVSCAEAIEQLINRHLERTVHGPSSSDSTSGPVTSSPATTSTLLSSSPFSSSSSAVAPSLQGQGGLARAQERAEIDGLRVLRRTAADFGEPPRAYLVVGYDDSSIASTSTSANTRTTGTMTTSSDLMRPAHENMDEVNVEEAEEEEEDDNEGGRLPLRRRDAHHVPLPTSRRDGLALKSSPSSFYPLMERPSLAFSMSLVLFVVGLYVGSYSAGTNAAQGGRRAYGGRSYTSFMGARDFP